jgi:cleavage and polyadenylation specificity factor subunit 3
MAKVMGSLAMVKPQEASKVSGILIKRNFNYHIVASTDLPKYSDLTMSTVTQRQSVYFSGSFDLLRFMVSQLSGEVEVVEENRVLRAFKAVDIVVDRR